MGTRGSFGFRVDGVDHVVYNHFDSYPDALGESVLQYIAEQNISHGANMVPALSEQAKMMIRLEPRQVPTPEQIKELQPYTDLAVNGGRVDSFYTLLRNTQGDPKLMLEARYFEPADSFLLDGLFCEYAYIINLDSAKLEFYAGFFQPAEVKPDHGLDLGRYWPLYEADKKDPDKYGPIVLQEEYDLGGITMDTVAAHVEKMNKAGGRVRQAVLGEEPDEDE